jgi:hypothetical protein
MYGEPELSYEIMGLLLWLLAVDPAQRPNGVDEILQHPWFLMEGVGNPSPTGRSLDDGDVDTT